MNSENRKTLDTYRRTFYLRNKIDLRKGDNNEPLLNLIIYYTWKNTKSHTKTVNLKYHY